MLQCAYCVFNVVVDDLQIKVVTVRSLQQLTLTYQTLQTGILCTSHGTHSNINRSYFIHFTAFVTPVETLHLLGPSYVNDIHVSVSTIKISNLSAILIRLQVHEHDSLTHSLTSRPSSMTVGDCR